MTRISYVEIPVLDFDRAVDFYESVLDVNVTDSDIGEYPYGVIRDDGDEIGALVGTDSIMYGDDGTSVEYRPNEAGAIVYFTVEGELPAIMSKATDLGGSTVVEPFAMDGISIAILQDPAGNRIGLMASQSGEG